MVSLQVGESCNTVCARPHPQGFLQKLFAASSLDQTHFYRLVSAKISPNRNGYALRLNDFRQLEAETELLFQSLG